MAIPKDIAASVLFSSDRTCCVCRVRGKPIQIHHLDGDDSNNRIENLAVLCLDCHNDTQIQGGFHRKLDLEQIVLYRNDWHLMVSRSRARETSINMKKGMNTKIHVEMATSLAEIYREKKEYELLAMHYSVLGNNELRDKYVEKSIKQGVSDESHIFLRALQGRTDLIPLDIIEREIERNRSFEAWSQLARLYVNLQQWDKAAYYYCKSIMEDLNKGNMFAAAFYLKEIFSNDLYAHLFKKSLSKSEAEKDLWWQVRALDELGWKDELRKLLINNKKEIEESGDTSLLRELYRALGDKPKLIELEKQIARSTSLTSTGSKGKRR